MAYIKNAGGMARGQGGSPGMFQVPRYGTTSTGRNSMYTVKSPTEEFSDAAHRAGYRAGSKDMWSSEKPTGPNAANPIYRKQYIQGHRAGSTETLLDTRPDVKSAFIKWMQQRKGAS